MLTANTYSKATLKPAAGELTISLPRSEYFPSSCSED